MTTPQREALAALRFNWSETPDHVWTPSPYHVDGLHGVVEREIIADIAKAAASDGPSPIGLVVQGQKGVGKTHLLGWVRQQVHRVGGYFVLFELKSGNTFWEEAAASVRDGLLRPGEAGTQLTRLLTALCALVGVPDTVGEAITGAAPVTSSDVDAFVDALQVVDRLIGAECADTVTALVLYASRDRRKNGIGRDYLSGEGVSADERRTWGIRTAPSAMNVVRDVFRLLALVGPSVVAVDQLDTLVAKATTNFADTRLDPELAKELALIADGLMQLREITRRTLSIVACLPNSWQLLQETAVDTVVDRFTEAFFLGRITDAALGRKLVEKWLGVPYARVGFVPPHPTWPVAPSAFEGEWDEYTPRELQKKIDKHVEACLRGEIRELTSFDLTDEPAPVPKRVGPEPEHFAAFDARFAELKEAVEVAPALTPATEDEVMPGLLSAALRGWIIEVGDDEMVWDVDPAGSTDLHAGIRRTLDEDLDTTERWMFRAISAPHHRAVQKRMHDACVAAGIGSAAAGRHLAVIRNEDWAKGPKTRADLAELYRSGGQAIGISEEDVRTFGALREMLTHPSLGLREWLVARRPASSSALLSATLPSQESRPPPPPPDGIVVGMTEGEPVALELESLRKHAVIFAGSGSGKTVLIRRLIEECALRGVSAIVLDPNNDLARLGDEWPEPPTSWLAGDDHRARDYLANTDVVVWTPGRSAGRPLSFHPLPDFASVLDDHDEFTASVEAAVATLAPHAMVTGNTAKASRGKAVLREALTEHARTGSRSLRGFIEFLADLPEGVSRLGNGTAIAADLAESLKAATVNDPLFAGAGEPADPALLFTPAQGKRARISVISFVGLPSDEQRQGFVSQLQMEVFAWIKRNPAGSRPLGGLFVMDEAQTLAPSGGWTASTQSTIILASQARKYGLGLLFATQAPKGLHNQIPGNATTQFFGRLQSPAQLAAANEMARAKGSTVEDIAMLERGQFYVTGEAFGFRRIRTAMCLSHHPPSPLRLEEVIERSRA